jgi:hypothetical protein
MSLVESLNFTLVVLLGSGYKAVGNVIHRRPRFQQRHPRDIGGDVLLRPRNRRRILARVCGYRHRPLTFRKQPLLLGYWGMVSLPAQPREPLATVIRYLLLQYLVAGNVSQGRETGLNCAPYAEARYEDAERSHRSYLSTNVYCMG